MSEAQRTEDATHWVRPDDREKPSTDDKERGWRLHVTLDDFEGYVEVVEEQTFPERAHRADANVIRATNGSLRLNVDEAKWLRARLDEVIPELEKREAGE